MREALLFLLLPDPLWGVVALVPLCSLLAHCPGLLSWPTLLAHSGSGACQESLSVSPSSILRRGCCSALVGRCQMAPVCWLAQAQVTLAYGSSASCVCACVVCGWAVPADLVSCASDVVNVVGDCSA